MLNKQVLEIEEMAEGHRLFLPQVVWKDIWTGGLQRRHNSKR